MDKVVGKEMKRSFQGDIQMCGWGLLPLGRKRREKNPFRFDPFGTIAIEQPGAIKLTG
jgi:hypothetical protein